MFFGEERFQLGIVDDVSVVGHDDPEGGVDKKGLCVLPSASADCGVAGVADADVSGEALYVFGGKDVSDQTVSLFDVEAAVISDDAGSILAAVLDGQKPLVELTDDLVISVYSNHSTHDNLFYQINWGQSRIKIGLWIKG